MSVNDGINLQTDAGDTVLPSSYAMRLLLLSPKHKLCERIHVLGVKLVHICVVATTQGSDDASPRLNRPFTCRVVALPSHQLWPDGYNEEKLQGHLEEGMG